MGLARCVRKQGPPTRSEASSCVRRRKSIHACRSCWRAACDKISPQPSTLWEERLCKRGMGWEIDCPPLVPCSTRLLKNFSKKSVNGFPLFFPLTLEQACILLAMYSGYWQIRLQDNFNRSTCGTPRTRSLIFGDVLLWGSIFLISVLSSRILNWKHSASMLKSCSSWDACKPSS